MSRWADTSHYQDVDVAAYADSGFDRIGIKVTGGAYDGTPLEDPTFRTRWFAAGKLGLARVGYHFARNNNDGRDEYTWFRSRIDAAGGYIPGKDILVYDQEDDRGKTDTDIGPNWRLARRRTREFVAAAVADGVTTGWIYSGRWFLEPAGMLASDLPPGWRNLWISDYGTRPDSSITVPVGWTRDQLVARQYTNSATIPGIPGGCDANRTLREWIGAPSMATIDDVIAKLDGIYRLMTFGDAPDNVLGPDGTPVDKGSHRNNLERIMKRVDAIADAVPELTAKVDALTAKVDALSAATGTVELSGLELSGTLSATLKG